MRKTITGTGGMLLLQTLKELEPALRRGVERITRDDRPYLIDVSVAPEGVGADSTWHQDWRL